MEKYEKLLIIVAMVKKSPIIITENAAKRIQDLLAKEQAADAVGIRVSVSKGGCSGYKYEVDYANSIADREEVISYAFDSGEEVKVLIEPGALMYLLGSTMDYKEEKLSSGFTFQNPNETGTCGCGESFSV